jgi:ATP-dependent Zn protease
MVNIIMLCLDSLVNMKKIFVFISYFCASGIDCIYANLPFKKRLQYIHESLKGYKTDSTVVIEKVALSLQGATDQQFFDILKLVHNKSENHHKVITLYDFMDAHDQIFLGKKIETALLRSYVKRSIAVHEAGHAAACILFANKESAFNYVSLQPRELCLGHVNIIPLKFDTGRHKKFDSQSTQYSIYTCIQYALAGGIGEQLFQAPCFARAIPLIQNSHRSIDLHNYLDCITRMSLHGNQDADYPRALAYAHAYLKHTYASYNDHDILMLLLGAYRHTYDVLANYKPQIASLTDLLLNQNCVQANQAYSIFGQKRPQFYFEKKSYKKYK